MAKVFITHYGTRGMKWKNHKPKEVNEDGSSEFPEKFKASQERTELALKKIKKSNVFARNVSDYKETKDIRDKIKKYSQIPYKFVQIPDNVRSIIGNINH